MSAQPDASCNTINDDDHEMFDAHRNYDDVAFSEEILDNDSLENEIQGRSLNEDHINVNTSVLNAQERIEYLINGYLSERYSPDMLKPPLESIYGAELREATIATVKQVESAVPSLQPRERLEFVAARNAGYRVEVIWHNYITTRIRKILSGPSAFLTALVNEDNVDLEMQPPNQKKSHFNTTGRSIEAHHGSSDTTGSHHSVRDEYQSLEIEFAKEVKDLWNRYQIFEPESSHRECPFVNAEVSDTSIPIADLALCSDDSKTFKRLLDLLGVVCHSQPKMYPRRSSISKHSQNSQTITSSEPTQTTLSTRGDSIPPGSVLTVDFDAVRNVVQNGQVKLIY